MNTQYEPVNAIAVRRRGAGSRSTTAVVRAVSQLLACSLVLGVVAGFAPTRRAFRISDRLLPTQERTTDTSSINLLDIHSPQRHIQFTPLTRRYNAEKSDQALETGQGEAPPFTVTLEGEYNYRDALQRTAGWVGAAMLFGGVLWALAGSTVGEEFYAGYLVEQSLSVDNLFVFLLLFEYFKVPLQYQDRILNWGIYSAVVLRAVMIGLGAAALENFREVLLVFAAILVYSSLKFFVGGNDDEEEDPSQNSIVKFSRGLVDTTEKFDGDRFFTTMNGVRQATPMFICLVAIEISDIVFAVDSIPAVFGVTEVSLAD